MHIQLGLIGSGKYKGDMLCAKKELYDKIKNRMNKVLTKDFEEVKNELLYDFKYNIKKESKYFIIEKNIFGEELARKCDSSLIEIVLTIQILFNNENKWDFNFCYNNERDAYNQIIIRSNIGILKELKYEYNTNTVWK